jgi:hypothetical protein
MFTIWIGVYTSGFAAPGFQTLELCQAAATVHSAKVVSNMASNFNNKGVTYSCVPSQAK